MNIPDGAIELEQLRRELEDLRQEESRWRTALDCAEHGVWDWNIKTSKVFFSDIWKTMLGFEPHEITDSLNEWALRVHPDDMDAVMKDVKAHFAGETPYYQNEHRVKCKDLSWKWILDQGKVVARDDLGVPVRMVGTHTDITVRRTSEEKLKASEARFHGFMAFAPLAAWATHVDGRLLYANQSFGELLGRPVAGILSKHLSELFGEGAIEFQKNNDQVIATGLSVQTQEETPRSSGEMGTFLVTKFPLNEGFGGEPVIGGFAIDITKMKAQEVALIAAKDQAQEALRTKDLFMATMSHELRTPMHSILGYAELMLEHELSSEQRARLETIQSSAELLLTLIHT